ncbi:major facilitator superfamily domain-containing protein [Exophiala viscosa]|uniref:Major facilitator superfamily domain-containing protein n=1 Tax=Exophiala viscosa TaxID=2486360 RepID=A0AAN6I9F0_9EURO|nr:major facilitator superfamily domain-containing protein [Exophiala viscosa]KAI1620908.1 major facilitator superfamily domain-containing protein [Exophiala viscosa]
MDPLSRDLIRAEVDANVNRSDTLSYIATHGPDIERDWSHSTPSAPQTRSHNQLTHADTYATYKSQQSQRGLHPVEVDRISRQRTQHQQILGRRPSAGTRRRSTATVTTVTTLGAGKPLPPIDDKEEFIVEFDGVDDPEHPQNWAFGTKIIMSIILSYITFLASFASAIYSPAIGQVSHEFHVSTEVGVLGLSLYVLGFAFGPILWGPLSEILGRKNPLLVAMFGFSLFAVAAATAKDYQTLMLTRFFSGFFAAGPLAIVPACFADMYDDSQRGIAITAFAMAVFVGPFASPFTGGFITESHLHWRWTMYIASIMGWLGTFLMLFTHETYPPTILVTKAGHIRRETKNFAIHAKQEEIEVDMAELINNNFMRPIRLLCTEPIVFLITLYMSFIYGLIYLFLSAYPLIFSGVHGMSLGVGGLPFIGLIIGQLCGGIYIMIDQIQYKKKLQRNHGVQIPEWRLPPAIVGAVCFSIGLFWLGWTGFSKDIHWMAPTASGVVTGFGVLCIFLQCFNYLIDTYLMFAASAIAANSLLRSFFGAGFPLFATQTFNNLGIQWAGTLLGCLAAVMIPIPVVFYLYGHKIRSWSNISKTTEQEEENKASLEKKMEV